jgi:Cache 3/Cache 2 fusion domain/Protein of unknown function (DUF4239)
LFYWIYDYPSWKIGTLFAVIFVAVTWAATFVLRRFLHPWFHRDRRANEMVGFVLSSYSVFYGLLIGLIAVAAYQNFGTVNDVVTREASSLGALYRDLSAYPQPTRGRLQGDLREYTRSEIERDWPQQQRGIVPAEGTYRLQQFSDDLLSFQPADRRDEIIHAESLRQENNYMNLRRARLNSVTVGIPAVMWWVVGIGAVLTLLLVAMLDMEIHVHLILGAALSVFLGLVVFLIAAMDNPFRGEVSVTPDPFQQVYATLMQPSDAVNRAMAVLISRTESLGPPRLQGRDPVAGRDVPALYFGNTKINNSFDLVDEVAKEAGGAASLFVRSGDQFVRVSTNAKKGDGSRALGVVLDPKGPAIERVRHGEAYYGEAFVLDTAYIAGYEPIRDGSGNVIGIYSTGYVKP